MHIKRLLSGSLAALMVASSFNVPVVNAAAIDEPTEVVEETADDNSGAGDDGAGKQEEAGTTTFTFDDDLNGDEGETDIVPEETTPDEGQEGDEDSVNLDNLLRASLLGNQNLLGASLDTPVELTAGMISVADVKYAGNSTSYTVEVKASADATPAEKTTDYTVKLLKSGTEVAGIDDAGTYTVEVTSVEGSYFNGVKVATKDFVVSPNTVTFNANGGTGTMAATTGAKDYELPECTYTAPTGQEFAGWLVGSETTAKLPGTKINVTDDTTIKATWADIKPDIANLDIKLSLKDDATKKRVTSATYNSAGVEVVVSAVPGAPAGIGTTDLKVEYFPAATTEASDPASVPKMNSVGTYKVVVSAASEGKFKAGSKKEITFTITPAELKATDIILATTASAKYGYDDGKYVLKYNAEDEDDDNIDNSGTIAYAVEPFNSITGLTTSDYTVAYKNNDKVGTATVTVTLKDSVKNYTGPNGSKTIEKTFEIIDAEPTMTAIDITKAKVSNKSQTEGSIKYKDENTNKVTTKVVPKMDPSKTTIGNSVDLTESNVATATIDGLFDANGKKLQKLNSEGKLVDLALTTDYTVSAVANGSEGVVTVTFTDNSNLYEGSYDFKYTFVADCTEHSWHKVITKVPDFAGHDGEYEYRCDKCKKVASTNDRIKVDGKYVTVPASCTITALTLDTLKVTNGVNVVDLNDDVTPDSIAFKGTDIVAVTDSSEAADNAKVRVGNLSIYKNKVVVNEDESNEKTTEYKDDIFTFKYENNKAVAETAKVTLTFTGVLEDYKGATVTKEFEITKATEALQAPRATFDKDPDNNGKYHYGTKVTLSSATKNAKIYYAISKGANAVTDLNIANVVALENAIEDKELVEYAGPIELVESQTTNDSITLYVVATDGKTVLEADDCASGLYTIAMIPAAADYQGDVKNDDLPALQTAKDVPEGFWISELTKAQFNSATYNGKAHVFDDGLTTPTYTDDIRVFYGNKLLTLGNDFTIKYTNNVNAWPVDTNYSLAKQPTVTVTGKGEYVGSYTYKFAIAPFTIGAGTSVPTTGISVDPGTTVTIPETNAIQKPSFKLYSKATMAANASAPVTLVANKDYTVDYSNMGKEPGTYPVTINGMGNYMGSIAATVNVVDAGVALSKATVSFDTKNVVFDGTNQDVNVVPTVKIGDKILERGTDYDVVFVYNESPVTSYIRTPAVIADLAERFGHVYQAGKYTVTIVPGSNGKYAGSITKSLSITNKGDVAISKATIEGIANNEKFDYLKNPLNASNIKLSYNGKTLTEGVDYLLGINYPKTGIGNGKLVIYGIGKFSGNKQFTYNVLTAGKLTKNDVEITDVTYDGTAQAPDIKVKFSGDADVEPHLLTKYDPITDPLGNYEVKFVTKDLVNAGTKTVKITGKNGYTGSFNVTYKVNPFDFDEDQAKYDPKSDANTNVIRFNYLPDGDGTDPADIVKVQFTGKGVAPVISSSDATKLDVPSYLTDMVAYSTWVSQNFTFKYSSNANKVGATVTVTATPKKNIKGSAVTMQYEVKKASLTDATITIKDKAADKTWANPAPVVKWGTKTLTNKKDYTVKYMYLNATTVTNKKAKVNRAAYAEVVAGDVIPANTVILARFEGTGNYTDSQDVQFRYLAKNYDISKATVRVYGSYFYDSKTDELPKLDVNDITVIIDGIVVDPKNYSIVDYAYPKNIIGTAKATLRGNEAYNYGGEKVVSFKIEKPQAKYMLQFMADSKAQDGSTLTITGQTARMTNAKSNTFTLPNSGFTAKKVTRQADGKKVSEKYVLRGWRAEDGTLHGVGELYTVKDDTGRVETLTAVFEKPRTGTYTVKFSKGTDAKITGDLPKDITANYGKVYQLPNAPKLKKVGFKFIGWKNTGDNITYKAGTKIYNLPDVTGKSLTYEAQFVATPYKVTFNMQGGVAVKAIAYENDAAGYASAVAQINEVGAAAIRDGYTFNGWKESPKGAVLKEIKITEGKNFTLYADWKPNKFKVTYYANGVSATVPTDSTEYSVGEKVTLKAMTATDATFLGWAKNQYAAKPDYKGGQVVSNFTPSGNTIDLYAIWATEAYTITYDMNGGTYKGAAQLPSTFTATNKPALAAAGSTDFVRAGMKFDGWAEGTSSKIGNKVTTLENRNYKLVATWVADTTTHKISFVTNGSTSMTDQANITNGTTVSIKPLNRTEVTKENYVFSGWDTNSAAETVVYGDGANITVSGSDITLYGVWSTESYPITYNLAGGKFPSAPTKQNTFNVSNLTVSLPNNGNGAAVEPEKNGYTFAGYKFKDDVAATIVGATTVTFDTAEAKILTAQWTGQTRTISYDWAGGNLKEGKTPKTSDTYTVGADNNPTALPNGTDYEKAGHTFAGWTLNGEDVTFAGLNLNDTGTALTLNLVAKWNPVTYTVSYKNTNGAKFKKNANGKDFVAPTSYKQTDGTVGINDLEDTATQTFAGWTVKVGSAEPSTATKGVSLTATIAGNVELTATWTNKAKTTVKFDANEGTGSMADQVVYAGDTDVTLKPVAFTRTGYSFDYWATSKTGTKAYDDEAALTPATSDSTITLYAKWKPWTRQVTLKSTIGTVDSSSPISISYTDVESARIRRIPEPTNPDSTKYTFKGWALKSNGGVTYAPAQTVDLTPQYANQKTILYAVWEEAKYATVVVDLDGGSGATGVKELGGKIYADNAGFGTGDEMVITIPGEAEDIPTKAGYTFSKWEVSGSTLSADSEFKVTKANVTSGATITVKAKYTVNTYNITYDDGIGGETAWAGTSFAASNPNPTNWKVTDGVRTLTNPTRTGYSFKGWKVSGAEDSTATKYFKLDTATVSGNLTLVAVWDPWVKTVTFNVNGGTGSVSAITFKTGQPIPGLPDSTDLTDAGVTAPTDKTFGGWSTKADGSAKVTELTAPTKANDTVTLYAIWVD